MRELTPAELDRIYLKRCCPFCPAALDTFIPGPRGGLSRNMTCAGCSAMVNILALEFWPRWPAYQFGQLIEEPVRRPPPH